MSLAQLIQVHAPELATAKDWAGVAAMLSEKTVKVSLGKVGGKASLEALVAAGEDPNAVIGAMRAVPMASVLLDTLISSGVDWDDPMTTLIMGGLVDAGLIKPTVVTAMQSLSMRMTSLAGADVTAEECKVAWEADAAAQRRESLRERFDTAMNQIGTTEQPLAVIALRAMADELEAG